MKSNLLKLQYNLFKHLAIDELNKVYSFIILDLLDERVYASGLMKKRIKSDLENQLHKAIFLFKKNLNKNKTLLFTTYAMYFLKETINNFIDKYPNSIKDK